MKTASFHILRVGMAVTFLWIGILILKEPEAWGDFIQPWAADILPVSLKTAMLGSAILDISVGFLLLIGYFTWQASLLASFHLITVLAVAGINAITIRDLGLLAASLALLVSSFPIKGRFNINN
ncbi:MAG: DoxX family membrane protein [Candidatus Nealsonbacteria bacterium]|nr:DoxX family membrane protein [Candidatus Nealsonbacteria bacterium]